MEFARGLPRRELIYRIVASLPDRELHCAVILSAAKDLFLIDATPNLEPANLTLRRRLFC